MAKEIEYNFDELLKEALKTEEKDEYIDELESNTANNLQVKLDKIIDEAANEKIESEVVEEVLNVKEEDEKESTIEVEEVTCTTEIIDDVIEPTKDVEDNSIQVIENELIILPENAISPKELRKLQRERKREAREKYKKELAKVSSKGNYWGLRSLELSAGFFVALFDILGDKVGDFFDHFGEHMSNIAATIVDRVDFVLDVILWWIKKHLVLLLRRIYTYRESLYNRRRQVIRTAIVTFFIGLVLIITYVSSVDYEYSYNGIKLGVVNEQKDVIYVLDMVSKELTTQYGAVVEIDAERDIEFSPILSIDRDVDSMDTVLNKLSSLGDINVTAYAIIANNETLSILDTEVHANEVLERIKNEYIKGDRSDYEHIGFVENVKIEEVQTTVDQIMNRDSTIEYIMNSEEREVIHTVVMYDNPDRICEKYGITKAQFYEYNPTFDENNYYLGDELVIMTVAPRLTLETVRVSTFKEITPYNTVFEDDSSMYLDSYQTHKAGVEGERIVTARITEINGVEIERFDLEVVVVSEPQDRIIKHGTKPIPPREGTGTFITPLRSYSLGTVYGYRIHPITGEWKLHTGSDFQAPTGTYVYACDGGIVTKARWHDSFGWMVQIDHGGLLSTMYAHNSELLVSEGERVYKGQIIAKVGSTGDSTGPHCHLEMYYDGQNIDPRTYIPY